MANYDVRFHQFADRSYAEAAVPVDETGRPVGATRVQTPAFDAESLITGFGGFASVASGDFVARTQYSNGQTVLALSGSPTQVGESVMVFDAQLMQPCAVDVELSTIRARHQFTMLSLFEDGDDGASPVPSPINITSIYQSSADNGAAYNATAGTICTVVLETALPPIGAAAAVFLSDWIHIAGLVDTRLNYQNACIKFISADRKTITFGFSDEAALPSLAVAAITPPAGTAKVYFYNNMAGARSGFGYRFTGTTATSAALVSAFGDGDAKISGTLLGDHRATIGSTAPQYLNGVNGNVDITATSRFRLEGRAQECAWLDKAIDNTSTLYYVRAGRSAVKPHTQHALKPRIRLYQPVGMTRPVAEIVSIAKSGTTTATITHDSSYPFQTGNYVTIKGVRDQANFAAFTTPVAITVLSSTQFTCVLGSAVTATSYGGSVVLCNGGIDQPGIIGQTVQSAVLDANGWITLVGNTTWSGLAIGDYVELHGVRESTAGADLGVDGAWEVAYLSTTTLQVKPITNINGARVSPARGALSLTNCGGTVILRTTIRVHDIVIEEWVESRVSLDGQGTGRIDKAMPVNLVAGSTTATVYGNTAVDSAMPNPVAIGGRASNANIAAMSAAGDLVAQLMTMIGAAVNKPFSLPEADWSYTGTLTVATDTTIMAAAGAGIKRYLTAIQVQNTNATATTLVIKDGTTAKHTISLPASMTLPIDIEFPTPIQTTANAALNIACGTAGANVLVNAQGYTAP